MYWTYLDVVEMDQIEGKSNKVFNCFCCPLPFRSENAPTTFERLFVLSLPASLLCLHNLKQFWSWENFWGKTLRLVYFVSDWYVITEISCWIHNGLLTNNWVGLVPFRGCQDVTKNPEATDPETIAWGTTRFSEHFSIDILILSWRQVLGIGTWSVIYE